MIWEDLERGYSSKLVGKERLWARKIPRNELLDEEKSQVNDSTLTFNVTYYPLSAEIITCSPCL